MRATTSCSSRTPTSSTTRASTAAWSSRSRRAMADVVYGSRFLSGPHRVPVFWHYRRQQAPDHALQHVHEPEPDRHGDLLQGVPPRGHPVDSPALEPLRLRARDHGQAGPPPRAHLRDVDLLLRPDLRRGEEDHLARRLQRRGLHPPLPFRGLKPQSAARHGAAVPVTPPGTICGRRRLVPTAAQSLALRFRQSARSQSQ